MIVDIVSRATWGARYANGVRPAPVPAVGCYLHHAVSDPKANDIATTRALEDTGQARFGYGISYSFVVHGSGAVHEGHSVGREGTHTLQTKPVRKNLNPTHRAIVYPGNFENRRPTPAQIESTAWLVAHGWLVGWWTTPALVGGHRDVTATACPGTHAYAQIPTINARTAQILAELGNPPTPPEDDDMKLYLVKVKGTDPVFVTNLVERWPIVAQAQIDNLVFLGAVVKPETGPPWWEWERPNVEAIPFAPTPIDVDALATAIAAKLPPGTVDTKAIAAETAAELHRRLAS